MQDFKKIANNLKKSIEQMKSLSDGLLKEIQDKEPEKVSALLKDNAKVMEAIKNRDLQVLTDLQKKYADNSN
tara:strand:+ start:471 stop:686 length:216 start_codon:yes stop_codon:yes gene_type:complete